MGKVPTIIPIADLRLLLHLLARGEQEIKAGKGFDLDEVLAEADDLLAAGRK